METTLDINRLQITVDDDYPDKVELYILDEQGAVVEGGQFDRSAFMDWIYQFYNNNY